MNNNSYLNLKKAIVLKLLCFEPNMNQIVSFAKQIERSKSTSAIICPLKFDLNLNIRVIHVATIQVLSIVLQRYLVCFTHFQESVVLLLPDD